ncbi:MAG: hypothetical protein BJ554DRAFT_6812 [Olpidium bornovanus]|uniref:Uncharacterized protein n=1 Tax=Olpidium bornovanus TaxID=278681 RepID=A0A8H7ZX23_9FUNG|nr:MAG: hypothetical protein BJ554DRAFT_6812 [Olpidium bornovanus]
MQFWLNVVLLRTDPTVPLEKNNFSTPAFFSSPTPAPPFPSPPRARSVALAPRRVVLFRSLSLLRSPPPPRPQNAAAPPPPIKQVRAAGPAPTLSRPEEGAALRDERREKERARENERAPGGDPSRVLLLLRWDPPPLQSPERLRHARPFGGGDVSADNRVIILFSPLRSALSLMDRCDDFESVGEPG